MLKQYIATKVRDRNGNIVGGFDKRPARSFVKNFYNKYMSLMLGVTPSEANDLDVRRSNGTSYNYNLITSAESYGWRGDENIISGAGIIVGSGDTAEDFGMGSVPGATSYSLDTTINNGSGAGELERASTGLPVISTAGADPIVWSVVWTRYFNNNSGGNVVVREIGVQSQYNNINFLISRDVLVSPLTINDTGSLEVEYTLTLSIPA